MNGTQSRVFVAEQRAKGFADTKISRDTSVDGVHDRVETRATTVIHDVEWLQDRHGWPGPKSVAAVDSRRETSGKAECETRLYLASLALIAALPGPIVCSHWAIEYSLHWVPDMIFRDDECRVRTDQAPANCTTINHMAFNLLPRCLGWVETSPATTPQVFLCSAERRFSAPA